MLIMIQEYYSVSKYIHINRNEASFEWKECRTSYTVHNLCNLK